MVPATHSSPIEQLDYALPGRSRRPTILTALCVLSILMACFTLATSGWMGYAAAMSSIDFQADSTPATAWSPPSAPLTPHHIDVVRKQIEQSFPQKMNAQQAAALAEYLASPRQALLYPGSDRALIWQIHMINSGPDGMGFKTMRGALTLHPSGGVTVHLETQPYAQSDPKPYIEPAWMTAAICEAVSLFLGLTLLWGAIQVLRNSSRGYTLHRLYALVKIPLAIIAAVAWFEVLQEDYLEWFGPLGVLVGMLPSLIGLCYAIIVLLVLHRPAVRDFFANRQAVTPTPPAAA